ncbi:hypothetical protein BFW01_g9696 [Lasiodiplodia theobromae]|uniref:Uncharacterized protein n=1 Tax=Lasiodiplodia theobromae TaxID=45133 RepID=A0A5N5DIS2_9PEZI|nr:uncharacterized protein LTHEOB_2513 [Lasiodiplodia theobromae]KAB2577627.1 hypothetical protein DBV05_g3820 [Lasiodiplodia theobromae]KAF4535521.1 hypothetical protein LTHEOB_2513 [Lasiodiplodia theobromae]KAF9638799.1 hypothetical protein BFW01_g9696 [Lasiodiplodia theobromae]
MILLRSSRPIARAFGQPLRCAARAVSTLPNNPHIYVHTDPITSTHTLTLTPTTPPVRSLALGTTSSLPPTPNSFRENHAFHGILQSVLAAHAVHDPAVQSQAAAYASQAGSMLGGGGIVFPANHPSQQYSSNKQAGKRSRPSSGPASVGKTASYAASAGGAGGASAQGGSGGGGRGGWVHVSDQRNPPDYGRIAWPEDIFGSVEVDGCGQFVSGNGNYQESGTYRMCTNEGFLGLSPYLREKVVEKLKVLEEQEKGK